MDILSSISKDSSSKELWTIFNRQLILLIRIKPSLVKLRSLLNSIFSLLTSNVQPFQLLFNQTTLRLTLIAQIEIKIQEWIQTPLEIQQSIRSTRYQRIFLTIQMKFTIQTVQEGKIRSNIRDNQENNPKKNLKWQ